MDASAEMRVCNGSDASTRERLLFFIVTFLPRGAKQILGFEEAWQSLILRNPTLGTVALINWDKFGDIQGFGSKNTQHPTLL